MKTFHGEPEGGVKWGGKESFRGNISLREILQQVLGARKDPGGEESLIMAERKGTITEQ